MSGSFWPGTTAQPQPAGTHRVVRRDPDAPTVPTYLMPARDPRGEPRWSAYPSDAGLWSRSDAHTLAELHLRMAAEAGLATEVTVERRVGG